MEPTDADAPELLRRSAEGDEEAFVALYRRFQGGIYRFAWRMTGSREAAEDVTQETFLVVVRGPTGYDLGREEAIRLTLAEGFGAAPVASA